MYALRVVAQSVHVVCLVSNPEHDGFARGEWLMEVRVAAHPVLDVGAVFEPIAMARQCEQCFLDSQEHHVFGEVEPILGALDADSCRCCVAVEALAVCFVAATQTGEVGESVARRPDALVVDVCRASARIVVACVACGAVCVAVNEDLVRVAVVLEA